MYNMLAKGILEQQISFCGIFRIQRTKLYAPMIKYWYRGVQQSAKIQIFNFTGHFTDDIQHPFRGSSVTSAADVGGLALALYSVLWAYSGWSVMAHINFKRNVVQPTLCFSGRILCVQLKK